MCIKVKAPSLISEAPSVIWFSDRATFRSRSVGLKTGVWCSCGVVAHLFTPQPPPYILYIYIYIYIYTVTWEDIIKYLQKCEGCTHFCEILYIYIYIYECYIYIYIHSISQKWVHPSHFCKYFIISSHVTKLKKWHFATM